MNAQYIATWRKIIVGEEESWVLFENDTCMILLEPEENFAARAVELMNQWGPVHAGSSAGDFSTITVDDGLGWVVTSHHNEILTLVAAEESAGEPSDVAMGLLGRSKRDQDGRELNVIHVEDKRHGV